MNWLQTLVLGMLQGLTEFLPISSSGHLRIASEIFWGKDVGAAFTAVTQLGTEVAVLVYFRHDLARLFRAWVRGLHNPKLRNTTDYRMARLVIIGSLPIMLLGVALQPVVQTDARNLWLIGTVLIVFGVLLGVAERIGMHARSVEHLTTRDGVLMGFAQAAALVPGVSRSGGTITAGLLLGLTRPAAVRFSFLLAIPAVVAAGLFQLPDVFEEGSNSELVPSGSQMLVATVVAGLVGYAAIAWLLRWVEHHSIYLFVWYRVALGGLVLVLLSAGTISA